MFKKIKTKIKRKWYLYRIEIICVLLGLVFATLFFYPYLFITINPGQGGVLWRRFLGGTVVDTVYPEGTHFVPPWDKMYLYNTRVQEIKHEMDVLSVNGLMFHLSLSIRVRPDYDFLAVLHQQVGPNYISMIVIPEVESVLRSLMGTYKPEEVYTTQRGIIQKTIRNSFTQLSAHYIIIDDVIIREVELPPRIKEAIENKLKQQQLAQEYEHIIEKEKKERSRKIIEAHGIKRFQEIVSQSLTSKLLKWKGIEATLELAKSQNAKVVVIGRGEDGLPIILDTKQEASPAQKPGEKQEPTQEQQPKSEQPHGTNVKIP